jgi:non-specific serine/threonine protein kinase
MDNYAKQWTPDSGRETDDRLSACAAAAALGVSQRTVRRAIARGELPAVKRAGVFEIAAADVERFRARQRTIGERGIQPLQTLTRLTLLPEPATETSLALPSFLTPLIGRERQVTALTAALRRDGVRLLTLTGPAGVGKTRLAVATAAAMAAEFRDGVWFVPLAPVRDPALVPTAIAAALGVREVRGRRIVAGVQRFVRERRALLLLDNLEHVLDAAPVVTELLAACPHLAILVTSRAGLRLSGERIFAVPPLALPDLRQLPPLADLAEVPAVRLFVDRAGAVRDGFTLTMDNAQVVAEICSRLDGLPLAIELAAARSRVLSPPVLLTHLEPGLPLLTGGPRDAPVRHQTMREAIAWSHDLLTLDEQRLFRRLAVFTGGFTLDAAAAVRGPEGIGSPAPIPSVLDGIGALVDQSLLYRKPAPPDVHAEPRYGMLETVREFGLDQLTVSGEEHEVRAAHMRFFAAFVADDALARCPDQPRRIDRAGRDHDNLRAALGWAVETEQAELALSLAGGIRSLWWSRNYVAEGRDWSERVLRMSAPEPTLDRCRVFLHAGIFCADQGDAESADRYLREALAIARRLDHVRFQSDALRFLGMAACYRGDDASAVGFLREAVQIARDAGQTWPLAAALCELGAADLRVGDLNEATRSGEESLPLTHGGVQQLAAIIGRLALAYVALFRGNRSEVLVNTREALAQAGAINDLGLTAESFVVFAGTANACGDALRAARLLGAADALREQSGRRLFRYHTQYLQIAESARSALGEGGYADAWRIGTDLALEAAVAETEDIALGQSPTTDRPTPLTPRERQVLPLLVQGMSDRDIAEVLYVSRPTASKHVSAILSKLGVESRTAAVAKALRDHLI